MILVHLVEFLTIVFGIPATAVLVALHREQRAREAAARQRLYDAEDQFAAVLRGDYSSARRFPGARPDSSGGA